MADHQEVAPFKFHVDVDVRFSDLDAIGHVNNAVYITYFEIARIAYMAHVTPFKTVADFNFIVARTECNYRSAAYMGQRLRLACGVSRLGNKSFTMRYQIDNESGKLVANGLTVLAWYDFSASAVIPCPPHMRQLLTQFDADLQAFEAPDRP